MIGSVRKVPDSCHFLLNDVAFYGRTLNEYSQMFNFIAEDWIDKKVLDCNSGPSSFTAECKQIGIRAVACDPLYSHSAQELIPRADDDIRHLSIKSPQEWGLFDPSACKASTHYVAEKQRALFNFSRDYTQGTIEGRYIAGAFPELPFADGSFDLVLSAHLLFVYASRENGGVFMDERFPLSFHIAAIKEMIRISRDEVRIYPLKGPNKANNPMLSSVLSAILREDLMVELQAVGYKDIAGACHMLSIKKAA